MKGENMAAAKKPKKSFTCARCAKETSATNEERISVRLCGACVPDLANLAAMRSKSAKGSRKAETMAIVPKASVPARKRQRAARPATASSGKAIAAVAEPEGVELPETVPPAIGPEAAVGPMVTEMPVTPAKRRKTANPADSASEAAVQPVAETMPSAVPSAEVAELDQRIAETREAMNRLVSELSEAYRTDRPARPAGRPRSRAAFPA
ncbi:MAG: hypothetical protein FWG74_00595 [Planctomycetes bacterium]|nr:hypothetical protein [Planctomycetota bacterium]